jgi:phosphoserine phosphatase
MTGSATTQSDEQRQRAADWTAAVLETEPRVAVFDCDGTLWGPDSGFGFMQWTLTHGFVSRQASEWLDQRYRAYLAGDVDELTICGEMVQVYAGLQDKELRRAAARFVTEKVEPLIFPQMEVLVRSLRARGTEIWAVSSTCDWVVEAGVVERFGIAPERVLAARVAVVDGVATSRLLAVPTDEGKAEALRAAGLERPDAVFGNSVHDLAMLEMARFAFPVNPSAELEAEADRAGWLKFYPTMAAVSI